MLVEHRDFSYLIYIRRPCRNTVIRFGVEKLKCCSYQTVKRVRETFTRIDTVHERDTSDRRTPRDGISRAYTSIARQKLKQNGQRH